MAVVAVGAIMRGSGVGMPSSRGEHVSLYPVVRWAGLQEKEMEVFDDDVIAKFSTGLEFINKAYIIVDNHCSVFTVMMMLLHSIFIKQLCIV